MIRVYVYFGNLWFVKVKISLFSTSNILTTTMNESLCFKLCSSEITVKCIGFRMGFICPWTTNLLSFGTKKNFTFN